MLKTEYVENFADFYAKAGKYFEDHYKGCEAYRAGHKELNINVSLMQQMIDLGTMNVFVFKEEEDVIGYINVSISPSAIFKQPQAVIDFLYIDPKYRQKNYASTAIKEVEKELVREGVKDINICLPDKDYSENVAQSLGYTKTSTIYTKCLGDN